MNFHRWMLALNLTPVLWANIAATFVALVTASLLVWQNGNSRNLALGLGVLIGAVIAFGIQLIFELQPSTSEDVLAATLDIDRATPKIEITHPRNDTGPFWHHGQTMEANASAWLAQHKPDAFRENRLASDFILFSLIALLAGEESNWQTKIRTYRAKAMPGASFSLWGLEASATLDDCTVFTAADLHSQLAQAENLFTDALQKLPMGRVCLPPQSTIEISANALAIRNPIGEIVFHIASGFYAEGSVQEPPDYVAQYEQRLVGLNVTTTYFALRASHRQSSTYHTWASRFLSRAHEWFGS